MTRQHSIKSHVAASPPPPARSPPPPAASVSVQNHANKPPSLLRTMAEGMSFGTGSSLAREAVGQVLGSSSSKNKNEIIDPEEVYKTKTKTKTKCEEMLHDLDSCFHSQFACDDILQKYLAVCVSSSKTSGVRTDNVVSTMDIPTDKYASYFI